MRVLIATDSSDKSEAAVKFAERLRFHSPKIFDLMTAVEAPVFVRGDGQGLPLDLASFIDEEKRVARERLETERERLGEHSRELHVHVDVGPPPIKILDMANTVDADLIVMGAVGHSGLDRVLLGSVSDYVATHADVSTLVVRPSPAADDDHSPHRIVVALSGQPEDHRILDWIHGLRLPADAEVHLIRVLELDTFYGQDIRQQASAFWASHREAAQRHLLEMETRLQSWNVVTESHMIESTHVGEALVDYVEQHGCDLIVTGDSDSGLMSRLFLGSTSRYVLRHARCSVLIVRDKEVRDLVRREALDQVTGELTV